VINRRELLALIGGAVALVPLRSAAQPGLPVIGYLSNNSAEADISLRTGLLDGLAQRGFVVGRNVAIEYRFAEGNNERLPSLAAELIGLPAALLVAYGLPAAVPAKKATATVPIVFAVGFDPVQLGLVASFSRPAGNATGVHMFQAETISKRLELLREILPQPGLITYLHPGWRTPAGPVELREVETSAQAVGQPILVLQGRDEDEIDQAFATMAERQVRGLLFGASTYFQVIADKLIALAARYRIPASYEWREFVAAGGLMSYSARRREAMRLVGDYAGRILKGAAPADLPVTQSTRFELVINLETAKALGLTIPHTVLLRADEVIE
jgi:putative tryptophan/tyrosine transport system substrate-binding protein